MANYRPTIGGRKIRILKNPLAHTFQVLKPMVFNGKSFLAGDKFVPAKNDCSLPKLERLVGNRNVFEDPIKEPIKEPKSAPLPTVAAVKLGPAIHPTPPAGTTHSGG